jgi:uncharacterized iron-regulated membrane protein
MALTPALRQSMATIHTWCGIGFAALLFAMFWMGTLTVFDAEIDQWMKPELRFHSTGSPARLDQLMPAILEQAPDKAQSLSISPASARQPALEFWYRGAKGVVYPRHYLHPQTGDFIHPTDSLAGTGFIYPFHNHFHLSWQNTGIWLAGFAAMAMLLLLVTGVFNHRKIIIELFTFRPKKPIERATLDLHTLTALLALPFYLMIGFSGLLINIDTYLPWATSAPFKGDEAARTLALSGDLNIKAAKLANPQLASLDDMLAQAEAQWRARNSDAPVKADAIRLSNIGDDNAYVRIRTIFPTDKIDMNNNKMLFDANTGALIQDYTAGSVVSAANWIKAAHYIQFDHWLVRWLYFFAGLMGCVMIATGQLYWLRARSRKPGQNQLGLRLMRAMSVGAITGIILSTCMFFLLNRLLPHNASLAGYDRSELEVWAFFLTWIFSFFHAYLRRETAWQEQTACIAIVAFCAAVLNWLTTGDHPIAAWQNNLVAILGMDTLLTLAGFTAFAITLKLHSARNAAVANMTETLEKSAKKGMVL